MLDSTSAAQLTDDRSKYVDFTRSKVYVPCIILRFHICIKFGK